MRKPSFLGKFGFRYLCSCYAGNQVPFCAKTASLNYHVFLKYVSRDSVLLIFGWRIHIRGIFNFLNLFAKLFTRVISLFNLPSLFTVLYH